MPPLQLSRRPEQFATGTDLAVGTYHVEQAGEGFTICRTIGPIFWYPLTARVDPAWRTWPTRSAALLQIDQHSDDLCDYPFWGR